ncbi:MAG: hypothetical protein JJ939_14760, partial [Alphaproteobacteria bacterium]|nr:hypothetical protein [Alphaproteobacteria bacterium]
MASSNNLIEVEPSEVPTDVLDAVSELGTVISGTAEAMSAYQLSPSEALKSAGRVAGPVGAAASFYSTYVESGDALRATAGLVGGVVGGVAVSATVVALAGAGAPVILGFAVIVAGGFAGEKIFLAAYDGTQWAYQEATAPLPLNQLVAESGLLPVELEGRLYGTNLGDDLPLERLVETPNGLLIAQQESSYFNHNAVLWDNALSQSGLSESRRQAINIEQVERLKAEYISVLRAEGKTVTAGTIAEIYGEIISFLEAEPGKIASFNGGARLVFDDILAPLTSVEAIAHQGNAFSTPLIPELAEVQRFAGESTLFSDTLADNAVLKFDARTGVYQTISRVTLIDPSTGQEVSVWVSDTGESVGGLVTITHAELEEFSQTGKFAGGDRYKAFVTDHGEISLEQAGGFASPLVASRTVLGTGETVIRVVFESSTLSGLTSEQLKLIVNAEAQCFAAGTPVEMADGSSKPIEKIRAGDWVLSFDQSGNLQPGRVTSVFESATNNLLTLSNGLVTTPGHPFLTSNGSFSPILEITSARLPVVDRAGNEIYVAAKRMLNSGEEIVRVVGGGAMQSESLFPVFNFSVEGYQTYVAGGLRVHNTSILDLVDDGEVVKEVLFGVDADIQIAISELPSSGEQIVREGRNLDDNNNTDLVKQTISFKNSDAQVVQVWEGDDLVGNEPQGIGELEVHLNTQIISGEQIGNTFGSALGNYIGDNALEEVVVSSVLGTTFGAVGEAVQIFTGDISVRDGDERRQLTFGESVDEAFENFDSKLAANAVGALVGRASSFVVSEIIGGRSFAADLGRAAATSYLSSVLKDVAIETLAAGGFQETVKLLGGVNEFAPNGTIDFGFNPNLVAGAIGGLLGGQLGNAIVGAPNTPEGQLVSGVTSTLVGIVAHSVATSAGVVFGTFASFAVPFVGAIIGTVIGNLLGSIFNDDDYPRAVGYLHLDADGRLYHGGSDGVDGMDPSVIQPMIDALVNSFNSIVSGFGPDAGVAKDPGAGIQPGYFAGFGYIATGGYRGQSRGFTLGRFDEQAEIIAGAAWNQRSGFDINDFESVAEHLILGAIRDGMIEGADAIGWRVYHYTEWSTLDELTVNLQIAKDYRSYLENREVIDRLIQETPDSSFAAGWTFTLAQAIAFGFTDEFAAHVKIDLNDAQSVQKYRSFPNGFFNPTYTGTAFNDEFLNARTGDTLRGEAGNDYFEAGARNLDIHGGTGIDTVSYRNATTNVWASLVDGGLYGGADGDTFSGIERLIGGNFADRLWGDDESNLIAGLSGDDRIYAGGGDDHIEGGVGADRIDGGDGLDVVSYITSSAGVSVTLGEAGVETFGQFGDAAGDRLLNVEQLIGSHFSDELTGNSGANILAGESGNDFIEGAAGADTLIGGQGFDFLVYRGSDAAVTVNLKEETASGGHAEGDRFAAFEGIIGSSFADTLIGDDGVNVLEGGAGADYIDGGAGNDAVSYAESTSGVTLDFVNNIFSGGDAEGDTLVNIENAIGSNHDDVITVAGDKIVLAGAGNDTIRAFGGNVRIDGGAGFDRATFEDFDKAAYFTGFQRGEVEVMFGDALLTQYQAALAGTALDISGLDGRYQVELHSIEWMRATNFSDIIDFDDIGQYVLGGGGDDIIYGKAGDDYYLGESGNDRLDGGVGNDRLDGGVGSDTLVGRVGNDTYMFGYGDGMDVIEESSGVAEVDVLEFKSSVRPEDVSIALVGTDLTVSLRGSTDTITIKNWTDSGQSVERFRFLGTNQTVNIAGWSSLWFAEFFNGDPNHFRWSGEIAVASVNDGDSAQGRPDLFFGTEAGDHLVGMGGDDVLLGLAGDDVLEGGVGDDTLSGGAGNDTLRGGAGDDVLIGGEGVTNFDGGEGIDTADFSHQSQGVSASLSGGLGADTFTDVENLVGSDFDDVLVGDDGDNVIDGGLGADQVSGGGGHDTLLGS